MKINRVAVEKGLSVSKGPDGPWEKTTYTVEATLEFESELDPAREKLERILDQWLAPKPSPPAPQAQAAQPPPTPTAPSREPVARIRLADKEVAQIYLDHIDLYAPLPVNDPVVERFLVPRVLKELLVRHELVTDNNFIVRITFDPNIKESQVKDLARALSWCIDKATSR